MVGDICRSWRLSGRGGIKLSGVNALITNFFKLQASLNGDCVLTEIFNVIPVTVWNEYRAMWQHELCIK